MGSNTQHYHNDNYTFFFSSIVGFTTMSKEVKPDQVMQYLNELFTAFDELVDTYQIYKVGSGSYSLLIFKLCVLN
jgi:class 3 adenylate cyclase